MIYMYIISFLPLFVFTFREKDFELLSKTISSSMITAALLDIGLVWFLVNEVQSLTNGSLLLR